jgi:hypothetical protein
MVILRTLAKAGFALFILNELRGIVLAVPVLIAMYHSGGTWMALWLGFCSLAGIVLSVVVPVIAARFIKRRFAN